MILELAIYGAITGTIIGLVPFTVGFKKDREVLAFTSLIACLVVGGLLGAIGAIPTALIFIAVALFTKGGK